MSDEALANSDVGRASTGLLGSLSLLFVPAGVGVVQYLGLLGEYGLALAAALVGLDHRNAAGDRRRLPAGEAHARRRVRSGRVNSFRLWVYLQTTPLFWLTATLGAFLVADALARALRRNPLANPVLIAVALVAALLKLSGTDYQTYFNGAQFVHFLLGPATVALGVPLYRNLALVRAQPAADGGGADRRRGRRDRLGGRRRRRARRAACRAGLAGAEIGHGRASRWRSPKASAACRR